jgi:hypothetical protein
VPRIAAVPYPPEHALYAMIEGRAHDGAHAAYNAVIQRLVSFANAYCRLARNQPS